MNEKKMNNSVVNKKEEKNLSDKKKKRLSSTSMQEIRWNPDEVFKENKYYTKISAKFKICKYVTVVIALIFTVVMLTVYSSDITSENFQYLIKDLDITGLTTEGDFKTIVYSGGANSKFGIYKDELAVINTGSTNLFASSGALSFSETNIFYSPEIITSEKYFIVYDKGDTTRSYSLYNSFAHLKSEKLDYPIIGMTLADSGTYAVITSGDGYRGVVLWYDEDFKLISEIKKDKYIIFAELSPNGQQIAIASVYDEGGELMSEIMLLNRGEEKAEFSLKVIGDVPISLSYMNNGNIALQYTERTVIYSSKLEEISSISLESLNSARSHMGENLICIVNNNTLIGDDKTINVYDDGGKLISTFEQSGELLKIASFEKNIYLLFEDRVVLLDVYEKTDASITVEPNAIDIVFTSSGKPIICYAGNSYPLEF